MAFTKETLTELMVCGEHYDIIWIPHFLEQDQYGCADTANQAIHIRQGMNSSMCLNTLLHETIHCISDEMNIDITEHQTHILGWALSRLLQDNPDFRTWIEELCKN
jgi:hypothetical protein